MAKSNFIVRGGADFSGIAREMQKTQKQMSAFQNNIKQNMSGIGTAFKVAIGYISFKAVKGIVKATTSIASDLTETQNVVDVVFGSMAKDINDFSKIAIEQFGLSELSAKKYSSTMGAMLKSSGLAGGAVRDIAMDLTKLSADMASFYNLDNEVAFQKIMSGMSGMTMPLKELGINMNIANLEAYALARGIKKPFRNMSQAEQTIIRYNYLLSVTNDAQGDFARNSHTWANQTKILSQQWEILKGTIGAGFINALMPVVKWLNIIIKRIQVAAEYFKAFTRLIFGDAEISSQGGVTVEQLADSLGDAEEGFSDAGKAGKKAAKDLKGALVGFDEINQLADKAGDGADGLIDGIGGVAPVDLGKATKGELDIDTSGLEKFTDAVKNFFEPLKNINLDNLKQALANLKEAMFPLTQTFFSGLHWAFTNIFAPLAKLTIETVLPAFLNTLAIAMTGLNKVLENAKPVIIGVAGAFGLWKTIEFANYVKYIGALTNTTGFVALFKAIQQLTFVGFANLKTAIISAMGAMKTFAVSMLSAVKNAGLLLVEMIKQAALLVANTAKWIAHKVALVASTVAQGAMTAATLVWNAVAGIATGVTAALGAAIAFLTSPIGLAILAITAITTAGVLLYKNWDTVKAKCLEVFSNVKSTITGSLEVVTTKFKVLINFLSGTFTNAWSKVWNGAKSVFKGVFDSLVGIVKVPLNLIIGAVNAMIRGLNKISIDVPDWVAKITPGLKVGDKWGFNIKEIPKLARGGITTGPMVAMVGDNPGGREVISPLDDLTNIIASAVGTAIMSAMQFTTGSGSSGDREVVLSIDGTKLGRALLPKLNQESERLGYKTILQTT